MFVVLSILLEQEDKEGLRVNGGRFTPISRTALSMEVMGETVDQVMPSSLALVPFKWAPALAAASSCSVQSPAEST